MMDAKQIIIQIIEVSIATMKNIYIPGGMSMCTMRSNLASVYGEVPGVELTSTDTKDEKKLS